VEIKIKILLQKGIPNHNTVTNNVTNPKSKILHTIESDSVSTLTSSSAIADRLHCRVG